MSLIVVPAVVTKTVIILLFTTVVGFRDVARHLPAHDGSTSAESRATAVRSAGRLVSTRHHHGLRPFSVQIAHAIRLDTNVGKVIFFRRRAGRWTPA